MYLKSLHLRQFRNYIDQRVEFLAPKTILVGNNAQGKSNLLEAVELLSTLKSHRAGRDRDLVRDGEPVGQILATLERDIGSVDLTLTLRSNGRRSVALNGESVRRHLDFLGVLNVVQFSSLDLDLVRGGPDRRRGWLDGLVVQLEPVYAHILQQYQQVLRQRNALLKFGGQGTAPKDGNQLELAGASGSLPMELDLWNAQLVETGVRVIRRRARVLERLAPIAQAWHRAISGSTEDLTIRYAPSIWENLAESSTMEPDAFSQSLPGGDPQRVQQVFWEKLRQRSIAEQHQGTTLVGPHRDEIELTINQTPARQYGSQGQQRTLVLALKLAELKLIEEVVGEPPLLLLDDVLAELDLDRQNQLLSAIQDHFQTLITTTHLGFFDAQWLRSSQILTVKAGQVST